MKRVLPVIIILGLCVSLLYIHPAAARPLQLDLNSDLISCWSLDETSGTRSDSYDSNHLTDTNTVGYGAGIQNNAASFTAGNSESLSRNSNTSLQTGDIDWTYALWVKSTSSFDATSYYLLSKWGSGQNEFTFYYYGDVTRVFRFSVSSDGASETGSISDSVTGALSSGTWYLIIIWHDATNNQLGIQVNNATASTTSYSSGVYVGTADLFMGGYWDGLIDEVGFWKKILTSDEKTWLYNSGYGRACADIVSPSTPTPTVTLTPTVTITPTPTATPANFQDIPLTYNYMTLERKVSYGDIAVVVAISLLILVSIAFYFVQLVRSWLR